MSKVISGKDLRARLMARMDSAVDDENYWLEVLSTPGHRDLLQIIFLENPQSVSELSRLASRAQPNVSRSLSALMRARLVELKSSGRMSAPMLTEFGHRKLEELGLLKQGESVMENPVVEMATEAQDSPPYLFVSFNAAGDDASGRLCINAPINNRITVGTDGDNLRAAVMRLFDNWWRIWYRRDAPYKVGAFSVFGNDELTLLFRSTGPRVERLLRIGTGAHQQLERDTVDRASFEQDLFKHVFDPVAAAYDLRMEGLGEIFSSNRSRLLDSYSQPAERDFCRTAGALNLMPYSLSDGMAEVVRELISSMPDEDSRLDFASVVLIDEFEALSAHIREGMKVAKGRNTLVGIPDFAESIYNDISGLAGSGLRPWQKGISAAKALRSHLKLGGEVAIGDVQRLARLFGADNFELSSLDSTAINAFQEDFGGAPTVLVQEEGSARGAAFALARAVGDYLVFQSKKSCVANSYTDRQAVGRAFAAEFMAPASGVISMVDEEERSFAQVAAHYEVPFEVVKRQYHNNFIEAA